MESVRVDLIVQTTRVVTQNLRKVKETRKGERLTYGVPIYCSDREKHWGTMVFITTDSNYVLLIPKATKKISSFHIKKQRHIYI